MYVSPDYKAPAPPIPPPLTITIATTPALLVYSLTGTADVSHRCFRFCYTSDELTGLQNVVISACRALKPPRVTSLKKAHLVAVGIDLDSPEAETWKLPLEIRTDNSGLIAIASALEVQPTLPKDGSVEAILQAQLSRFNVSWQLVSGSEELDSLRTWAAINFTPGSAASQDGPSRRDFQIVTGTYEGINRNEAANPKPVTSYRDNDWRYIA